MQSQEFEIRILKKNLKVSKTTKNIFSLEIKTLLRF